MIYVPVNMTEEEYILPLEDVRVATALPYEPFIPKA